MYHIYIDIYRDREREREILGCITQQTNSFMFGFTIVLVRCTTGAWYVTRK